uniref:Septin-8 n=1 Tax=Callithrix jacchus TaxID=9483 RepID=A0A2R8P6S6_CALJA
GAAVNNAEAEPRSLSLGGHVGFDSLPDQLVSKSVTQGFSFNILCVGETGIGKSTLMNTLFNTTFETEEASHHEACVRLRPQTYDLQESNVQLKLTIVDAVGFGDQINKDESYRPIVDYIDAQFENYLQEELKIRRSLFDYHDTRIHVCLYFITPTGHSLKSLDLVTMKKLDSKVNIIPIIAKADTISKSELHKFKIKIMGELVSNGVQIYQFPTDDEAVAEINAVMNAHLPFAVVGSTEEVKVGNKLVRARQYPWGVVQVENENHCDFVKLREMLIRVNMEDLREQTHSRHYELYRRCKLEEMGFQDSDGDSQPFSLQETYEAKRKEFLSELQRKEEEMRQMFVNKVKETELELKEKERELHEKFEHLKRVHQEEKRKVEEKRRELEEETNAFNRRKAAVEALQSQALHVAGCPCAGSSCSCGLLLPFLFLTSLLALLLALSCPLPLLFISSSPPSFLAHLFLSLVIQYLGVWIALTLRHSHSHRRSRAPRPSPFSLFFSSSSSSFPFLAHPFALLQPPWQLWPCCSVVKAGPHGRGAA